MVDTTDKIQMENHMHGMHYESTHKEEQNNYRTFSTSA